MDSRMYLNQLTETMNTDESSGTCDDRYIGEVDYRKNAVINLLTAFGVSH